MLFIGIDPGLDGAIAVLDDIGAIRLLADTPTLVVQSGKQLRREYAVREMVKLVARAVQVVPRETPALAGLAVAVEQVHARPMQGVRSMFSLGRGLGLWEGILAGVGLPYSLIPPQRWKRIMLDGMGKEKDAARLRAQQLFPTAELHLKKHHGRAEALLLAEYLRRQG